MKKQHGAWLARLLASASGLVLLSACAMTPQPLTKDDMLQQAKADQDKMFAAEAPLTGRLSLAEAVARALKYNLDSRTKMLERALALGQTDLDRWDLLPKVTANAGYVGRTDHATTRSTDSVTLEPALTNPYYSTDRDRLTAGLGVSWNVLDFGVSYFNARQNADRVLIAEEHRRKTIQNVMQEVRYDFWRAAAAQMLEPEVKKAIADGEQALADAREVETAGLKNPADTLRFEKNLLENLRELEQISQQLSTARVELAALINLPPGTEFTLDVPEDATMAVPSFDLPLDKMEEVAFVNNPDLREQGYLARVAVNDTYKTITRMMPGIDLSASRQWDSNSFLVDRQWYEAGARMSLNLINLLSLPDRLDQAEANEKVIEARRIALRMAVLAQVHISYRQFVNAQRQFERSDELYKVDSRLAELSAARTRNDAQGQLEQVNSETSAIASRLRRYQSYAQLEQALGRIYATLGEDMLPPAMVSTDLPAVTAAVDRGLRAWDRGSLSETTVARVAAVSSSAPAAAPGRSQAAAGPATKEDGQRTVLDDVLDWLEKTFKATPPPQPEDTAQQEAAPGTAVVADTSGSPASAVAP